MECPSKPRQGIPLDREAGLTIPYPSLLCITVHGSGTALLPGNGGYAENHSDSTTIRAPYIGLRNQLALFACCGYSTSLRNPNLLLHSPIARTPIAKPTFRALPFMDRVGQDVLKRYDVLRHWNNRSKHWTGIRIYLKGRT